MWAHTFRPLGANPPSGPSFLVWRAMSSERFFVALVVLQWTLGIGGLVAYLMGWMP